ncbi:MAG: HD domain-containing protein [Marinilabiliaceae bacterium]|nr:HD domain-containing protein [Marinilabiliaceae bacterium]
MISIFTFNKGYKSLIIRLLIVFCLWFITSIKCVSQTPVITVESEKTTYQLKQNTLINISDYSSVICIKIDLPDSIQWRYKLDGHINTWSKWDTSHNIFFQLSKGNYVLFIEENNGKVISFPFKVVRIRSIFYYLLVILIPALILWLTYIATRKVKSKLLKQIQKEVRFELEKEFKLKQLKDLTPVKNSTPNGTPIPSHKTYSKKYEQVSVLFADIQGFTKIVEHINPELLIDELDKFFFHFDEVAEKYSIEKIKTIGDAYMCAGGIPEKNRTNPVEVVLAALEMQEFMKKSTNTSDQNSKYGIWELRIGIHTGPVISGMVGRKKIAFDIWGDTVNIASRMESSGKVGEVNITGVTYQFVRDFFSCQYRGKMPIKYKGETDMYFVKGIKPELSVDEKGLMPNEHFFIRLQQIRFGDLEEFILARLRSELPDSITYHNVDHTIDVITRIEILGRGEEVSDKELLILKTAALLHDTGFIFHYENHEENSILIAKEILPKFKYSQYQIDEIIKLITVTKIENKPVNLLEEIMKDADLDYLGRNDFILLSENLFNELNINGKKLTISDWNQYQYDFIQNHRYYTKTAKDLRQVNKELQLQKLKSLSLV